MNSNIFRFSRKAVPGLNRLITAQKTADRKRLFTGKLRLQIMVRDEFRCVLCGREPSDGIKLVVDHVVPYSQGGKTILNNGQTLCAECNSAKSDRRIGGSNG
jgi:5-methylcytosine-specific restriction endonuclease McrA